MVNWLGSSGGSALSEIRICKERVSDISSICLKQAGWWKLVAENFIRASAQTGMKHQFWPCQRQDWHWQFSPQHSTAVWFTSEITALVQEIGSETGHLILEVLALYDLQRRPLMTTPAPRRSPGQWGTKATESTVVTIFCLHSLLPYALKYYLIKPVLLNGHLVLFAPCFSQRTSKLNRSWT